MRVHVRVWQRNFLSVAYPGYTSVTEEQPGSESIAKNDIIQALVDGAGDIQLPVERVIHDPTMPIATASMLVRSLLALRSHLLTVCLLS